MKAHFKKIMFTCVTEHIVSVVNVFNNKTNIYYTGNYELFTLAKKSLIIFH